MNNIIDKITQTIKNKNFNKFIEIFNSEVFNLHHKKLIYEIAYINQSVEIFQYLNKYTSFNPGEREIIFSKTLKTGIEIKNVNDIGFIEDNILHKNINNSIENLVKFQNDKFIISFVEKFPLTSFLNLKKILFNSFKYEKKDFIDYLTKQKLNNNLIFYCALCAVNFNNRDSFSSLLHNSLKHNPNILNDIKLFKKNYNLNIISSKEDFESFIDKSLIETFAKYLNEELTIKKLHCETKKTKRKI